MPFIHISEETNESKIILQYSAVLTPLILWYLTMEISKNKAIYKKIHSGENLKLKIDFLFYFKILVDILEEKL